MRVVARRVDPADAPATIAPFATPGQVFLTGGREYEVHALSVFKGHVAVQLVDDLHVIGWYPAWFFDVIDPAPASDWIVNFVDGEPSLIIGPAFVARDLEAYERMVGLETNEVTLFRERLRRLESARDQT